MATIRTFNPNPKTWVELHRALRAIRTQLPPGTYDHTRAPASDGSDDITQGWKVGSTWVYRPDPQSDTDPPQIYVCADNTEGSAIWMEMVGLGTQSGSPGGGISSTPTSLGGISALDANGRWGKLDAGANGFLLKSDTGATLGLSYVDPDDITKHESHIEMMPLTTGITF